MRPVIVLYAKAPVPGRVKTRLASLLGWQEAARLQERFVRDMLAMLALHAGAADLELHTDIDTDAWCDLAVARALQPEGDLGERMYATLEAALRAGRPQAMIVGGDAPTLPAAHIGWLLASAADVALGPCRDGGYYAIACRRVHRDMFRGVPWSSETTLQETIRACRACGLSVEIGREWFDVDLPADLERLRGAG